ncbi:MAG TPA: alpha/beta fold hydrolase [Candidatus Limnocylindrales bacterium]|nr:alpha/beta fold hydrolase [Candidatus Limnocylindrales bacterium]
MSWFLARLVAAHAERSPDALAVIEPGRAWTWAALSARADAYAAALASMGDDGGGRVLLDLPRSGEAIAALTGVLRAGATAALLPPDATTWERDRAVAVLDAAVTVSALAVDPGMVLVPAPADPDPEADAVVVLTSGTTGRPKGVRLSHRALAASADAWLGALPAAAGWAMPLGLAHVAGLGIAWRAVRDAVPVTLLPPGDPDALAAALRADPRLTHASLVPGQLARLLDATADAPAPPTVRALLLGGGPVSPALVLRAAAAAWPVVPTYGLSEMASGVTALPAEEAEEAPASAGRPLPGMSVAIEGPGADGVGEIVVRGPARSSGYLGEPAADAREPLRTGDLGRLDEAGRLIVVDRRTDRIVRGGENVDPGEVEAVLEAHPGVAEAAVVARHDATWGHVPVAAIVLREGAVDPGDEALMAHARASIAGFKVPAEIVRVDALPRTSGGKLRRDAVRALLDGARAGELVRPGGEAIGWRLTGDGPRHVLLLHGTLSTAQQLDRLAAALAAPGDVTVHALDRRGAGTSRLATPRPLAATVHLDDMRAYLDARRIDAADLVGVSFGGVLALELAARHPERVRAVLAYEPPYGLVADGELIAWFRRVAADTQAAHARGGRAGAAEAFLRHVAGDAAWDRLPDRARTFLANEGDGALADAALTGLDPDGLAGIGCPVAILTGTASEPFYAPIAEALARLIPGARHVDLDGLRHTSPITDASPVAAAVRAALGLPVPTDPPLEPAR